ncbi:MAG TPA: hypothetical protein VMR41_02040 [Patescibacteria group bacterium]|nr:hypothetical protein [Patescibacteria group bacterium]
MDDHWVQARIENDEKKIITVLFILGLFIIFLIADVIYLNFNVFKATKNQSQPLNSNSVFTTIPTLVVSSAPTVAALLSSTPPASSSVIQSPTSVIVTQAVTPTIKVTPTIAPPAASIKDYYIPMGTGSVQSGDWSDVPGAAATIDFGQYSNVKQILFEASIYIPSANETASVRLYNETDNHPVWYSNMTTSGSATNYLVSQPITYDSGAKLYQVQMLTQLQYTANLVQSRIHVILK